MGARRAGAPVLTGSVPPLAPFYHARQETGFDLADALRPGDTILLVPALLGTGGTGKTQLAVGFAHAMWSARAVDLLAWVPAGSRSAIIAGYARAAADLDLPADEEPSAGTADSAAQRFLDWLRTTERRWAVILDGVASPVDIDGLWPGGPAGQVVVTSRLRASELAWSGASVTAHAVAGFSRREALSYLNAWLTGFPDQRIEALDLAEDLGGLPVALAQAAAVVAVAQSTCRDYRAAYAERLRTTTETLVEGCPQPVLASWSLSVEHAHELPPAGLSWPALVFASALDTSGIPAAVLTSPAACAYITGRTGITERTGDGQASADGNLVRSAYAALERLGLLSVDPASTVRTVWLHTSVRAAVRAYLAPGNVEQVAAAAATALLEAWPEAGAPGSGPHLSQALRDSAAALRAFAGDLLWKPEAHPVLLRAGTSLTEAPALTDAAIGYWQALSAASGQLLGYGHAQAVLARDRLADAFAGSGRLAEALPVFEATLADREATIGPQHQETVTARLNVARSLNAAGREPEAIALYEQVLGARERTSGPGHRETLAVRVQLAAAYEVAGRHGDGIRLYERALADAERELGPTHRDALSARASLAGAYLGAGQAREAIAAFQRALADTERTAGADDPATLATRASLAGAYRAAGKTKEAIATYVRVVADSERVLGPGDIGTLTTRCSLATAYNEAGRMTDAVKVLRRALADSERYLGADHPMTSTVRDSLQAAELSIMAPRSTSTAQFDYIIVGGGSAGSALASRLSADPTTRVLVLEAGRPDYRWDPFIHMPAALTFPIGSRFYDWKYSSEPEPHLNGRRIYHARGKVLGGSSSINGMIFQRGNPLDYERWAADPGMSSWSYAHCLPYFKRMEDCLAAPGTPDAEFRGTDGPLVLERGPVTNPLFGAFFDAVQQAGYPLTSDVNGFRQEGFAAFDRNISDGRRLSAARAYLHPVMSRPNLRVVTWAHTTRILFNGTRATGVEFVLRGDAGVATVASAPRRAYGGEVIVCAGAFGSPQLLQLSGVGNAAELSPLGIPVVADLPGVGENMQDHLEVYIQYGSKLPVSVAPALKWRNRPSVALRWALARSGPGATNHFEAGGFVRSNDTVRYPNLMFHFLPIAIRYDGSAPAGGHGYQVHIGPMYSDSRGTVKLSSAEPYDKPALRFNYLSTQTDRAEWSEAIAIARRILNQPAFDEFNAGELSPGPTVSTEEEVLDWVARDAETALHPSCTCAMGTGPLSVTDPLSLAVHEVSGLRVVDASVMPYVTNGNIYAPTMMIAEKAADLITGDTPLPAATIPFYQHKSGAVFE